MSIFSQVSLRKPKTNTFNLSHDKKLSFNVGELIPILAMDCVPNDRINISTAQLVRFMPLVSPVMHRFDVYVHYFFVPNRIVWDSWESFITGGKDGTDTTTPPYIHINNSYPVNVGTIGDYMGLPLYNGTETVSVSAIPFAAYQKIYHEYYKDETLSQATYTELVNGNNSGAPGLMSLRRRSWSKDYFTSALPWTQRGPEATIPLGDVTPIDGPDGDWLKTFDGSNVTEGDTTLVSLNNDDLGALFDTAGKKLLPNMTVDATSINDLRRAFRLQEFLERTARGGYRYTEVILSHFGVRSSDKRMQRPEFIGGTKNPVQISEVLQTSGSPGDTNYTPTPQGNMAGHGISVGGGRMFSYFCEEHGYLMAIMSVLPKAAYQQGIPKHFFRLDRLDYYWPSFAHLGEQPILNGELYLDDDGQNQDVFGYTPRYAEYKYMPSTVHGEFRTTLDFWHAGRIFAARPLLNEAFVTCQSTEVDRIFAVEDAATDKLWAQVHHTIKARRPMPYFGTPKL